MTNEYKIIMTIDYTPYDSFLNRSYEEMVREYKSKELNYLIDNSLHIDCVYDTDASRLELTYYLDFDTFTYFNLVCDVVSYKE